MEERCQLNNFSFWKKNIVGNNVKGGMEVEELIRNSLNLMPDL
jgi:hypothetical protein